VRVGLDTYSFHRLLGALRPGESSSSGRLADGGPAAVRQAVALGCDAVSIQTCFLPCAEAVDVAALAEAAGGTEVILAWGAPVGLAYGRAPDAVADVAMWMDVALALDSAVMRIVLGGPAHFESESADVLRDRVVPQIRELAARAEQIGLTLAIENHGDITAADLLTILGEVDNAALGVCFDTANAARVGDDPVAAATELSDFVRLVHFKDVEPIEPVADRVAGPRSVPYGEGVIALVGVLAALRDPIEWGAPVCVELGQIADGTEEIALIRDSIAWLRTNSPSDA
jgi:sugar phosphate isomerase/epimerase